MAGTRAPAAAAAALDDLLAAQPPRVLLLSLAHLSLSSPMHGVRDRETTGRVSRTPSYRGYTEREARLIWAGEQRPCRCRSRPLFLFPGKNKRGYSRER